MTVLGNVSWSSTILPGDLLNLPNGTLHNGKIVPSVTSGNLTVAIKTFAGTDPSVSDPVYVNINGVIRTISSALSFTKNAATNWANLGGTDFATKEVDLFTYIGWNAVANGFMFGASRIPYARVFSDFYYLSETNEKSLIGTGFASSSTTDNFVCIGRFAATLSAGAGFTWSVPTFTNVNLVNEPIFETRILDYTPTFSLATLSGFNFAKYQIIGRGVNLWFESGSGRTLSGTGLAIGISYPFNVSSTSVNLPINANGNNGTVYRSFLSLRENARFTVFKDDTLTNWSLSETGVQVRVNDYYNIG